MIAFGKPFISNPDLVIRLFLDSRRRIARRFMVEAKRGMLIILFSARPSRMFAFKIMSAPGAE
jgi:hypothetical protein